MEFSDKITYKGTVKSVFSRDIETAEFKDLDFQIYFIKENFFGHFERSGTFNAL